MLQYTVRNYNLLQYTITELRAPTWGTLRVLHCTSPETAHLLDRVQNHTEKMEKGLYACGCFLGTASCLDLACVTIQGDHFQFDPESRLDVMYANDGYPLTAPGCLQRASKNDKPPHNTHTTILVKLLPLANLFF